MKYYDDVLLGALRLAQADVELGRLDDARLENIFQTVTDVVDDISHVELGQSQKRDEDPLAEVSAPNVVKLSGEQLRGQVFCFPGLGRLDDCAVVIVADVLKRMGIAACPASLSNTKADKPSSVCICYLENISEARIGYASRKMSRQVPSAKIVFALLGGNETPVLVEEGVHMIAHSLEEAAAAFSSAKMPHGLSTGT